ncbi:hypothetical protein DEO72_LG2g3699 [Vigna unguiculata]|uniref:U-box domain-containing protein n=1 Tax=Vigna unguiculata TaxID=3917 RepID=A0A4D6L4G9_VIGUN|nr:hypothetical protein DEO72_LG2g3699 [Vigna unguiculata]
MLSDIAGSGLSDMVKCEYGCRLFVMKNSKEEDENIHHITPMVSFIISAVMLLSITKSLRRPLPHHHLRHKSEQSVTHDTDQSNPSPTTQIRADLSPMTQIRANMSPTIVKASKHSCFPRKIPHVSSPNETLLDYPDLAPNHMLQRLIQTWCSMNASHIIERIPTPNSLVNKTQISKVLKDASHSPLVCL